MRNIAQHLSQYAAYHRDRRTIATHFVGIPMIVFGVAALIARPHWMVAGLPLSPSVLATLAAVAFYFALDLRYALAMTVFMGLALATGSWLAMQSTAMWLSVAGGLFVVGWIIQFIGHWFEGKKPAFVDDLAGFLIGPLFIVAEASFALGMRRPLLEEIERNAGPTLIRSRTSLRAA